MDAIVQLDQGWRQGFAAGRLAQCLHGWAVADPALARFAGDPDALFRFLRTRPTLERDRVFCALLRQAKRDQLAGLVVLEALLPGLKAVRRRIVVEAGEGEEVWALLLASAWARIINYPLEHRPGRVAANLLLDIRKTTLKELVQGRAHATSPLTGREPAHSTMPADVEGLVGGAVRAGALSGAEAELILETRIDRRSLPAIATETGVTYLRAYKRRARAERRLLMFLGLPQGKNRRLGGHISDARSVAVEVADSASGGAVT